MTTNLTLKEPLFSNLPVLQSGLLQSSDEVRNYSLDISDYTSPNTPVVTATNLTTEFEATSAVVTTGGVIVSTALTFTISNLETISRYKIDIKFSATEGTFEPYLIIDCNA